MCLNYTIVKIMTEGEITNWWQETKEKKDSGINKIM